MRPAEAVVTLAMAWKPRKPKWDWRAYLTEEERQVVLRAERAKREWLELNRERAAIANRAIHRAKFAAGSR